MKTLYYLFLAAAIGAMYVLEQHRTSPLGMTLVEWQTLLGQPPSTILGLIAAGLLVFSRRGRKRTQRATRAHTHADGEDLPEFLNGEHVERDLRPEQRLA